MKLRSYQLRALDIALRMKRCVIVMPTGSGKTVVAGAWLKELFERGEIRKALVLEPTRILVEQNSLLLRNAFSLNAMPLHGKKTKAQKLEAVKAEVVVATPEEAELWLAELSNSDALVVDECHHTSGKDPYVKVVKSVKAEWRLGLSAFIPPKRRSIIEKYIGPIIEIPWSDEEVRKYVPPYIGEVYEAPLPESCMKLYEALKSRWPSSDKKTRLLISLALRFLARDGPMALRESSKGEGALARLLKEYSQQIEKCYEEAPLHKLPALTRVLDDHVYEKALVFVDRVSIALAVAKELGALPLTSKSKGRLEDLKSAKVIVATSAGEEGLDLPEIDLLVIWSNTSSALRLIQRIGRLLRPKGDKKVKFLTFIVTPDTIDVDLLIEGLEVAKKVGVDPNVDPEVLRKLLKVSSVGGVLEVLRGRALPEDLIAELSSLPLSRVKRLLRKMGEEGIAAYVYSPYGKLWFLQEEAEAVGEELKELLEPLEGATLAIEELGLRGKLEQVIERLKGLLPAGPLTVKVRARTGSMEIFDVRKYNFVVSNEKVAEIVLRNATSKRLLLG
ncbi:DEAD/DEAH box helicase [Ignicoccus hospitalis]|uniref:DEAD/DEAH box helicase domain protein n=1 Tax=Ignicoccus hospitalis (strain KIN4/I / DSM 18386 / JCM 14125) TaxID=453591 RepID=A8A8S7_IGNH4|nr:DEAD/DEAH box helicase family protein [Ignicoccus hospitalis]ABU81329.1 DEAD/DEAH box helicase domain protein [Ignicoccus hospitalis KIN4/I]HIH90367.1 DEAD/DEAH box helicase family protein [Desulfurococcaceae archaeon]